METLKRAPVPHPNRKNDPRLIFRRGTHSFTWYICTGPRGSGLLKVWKNQRPLVTVTQPAEAFRIFWRHLGAL